MSGTRPPPAVTPSRREGVIYGLIAVAALLVSGIAPNDRMTWVLEVVWVAVGVPILVLTWRRFPLTRLLYVLILLHMMILLYGGHYTYAETPLGEWFAGLIGSERNPYDRLGHFAQGFVPAILGRELLLRLTPLRRGGWLFYLVTSACLAFSAFFEMLEWWVAVAAGEKADAFLATQGDIWDTQWDMFLALVGAMTAQVLLARVHDRQLGAEIAEAGVSVMSGQHAA